MVALTVGLSMMAPGTESTAKVGVDRGRYWLLPVDLVIRHYATLQAAADTSGDCLVSKGMSRLSSRRAGV